MAKFCLGICSHDSEIFGKSQPFLLLFLCPLRLERERVCVCVRERERERGGGGGGGGGGS